MRPKMTIRGVRGTIFMPQVKPSAEIIKQMGDVFQGWVPSIDNPDPNQRDRIVSQSGQWVLIAPDNNERIQFTPQKVDYLSYLNGEYTVEEIGRRMERCKEVFEKIISMTDATVTRIAFAPAYVLDIDENEYMQLIGSMFSHPTFKDSVLADTNFTQTFYVEEKLGERKIMMNYISKFESERYIQNTNGINQIVSVYTIEFDINTRTNEALKFSTEEVKLFCSEACSYGETFLDFYFQS